jgi:hypothetical protein
LHSVLCVHVISALHAFFAVVVELTGCVPSTICVLVLFMLPLVLLHRVAPPQWRSGAALPTRSWWASVAPQWARCGSGRWSGWSGDSRRSSGPSMGSKGEWSVCVRVYVCVCVLKKSEVGARIALALSARVCLIRNALQERNLTLEARTMLRAVMGGMGGVVECCVRVRRDW